MKPMNLSESQIETVLRSAPVPPPPPGLASEVLRAVAAARGRVDRDGQGRGIPLTRPRAGIRRWWPLLLPSVATVAFAAAVWVQHEEIEQLRTELAAQAAALEASAESDDTTAGAVGVSGSGRLGLTDRQDLERLRGLVQQLGREVASLEDLRVEVEALQAAIRAMESKLSEEFRALANVADKAQAIQCVNHLKQVGLAVRVWASDHGGDFPSEIRAFTAELVTPKILVCPADDVRSPAADWASYTAANCSYEFLSPGPGNFESEALRVLFRCPIHGHVGLCDGSVHQVPRDQPDRFETRDGVLYMKSWPAPGALESDPSKVTPNASNTSESAGRASPGPLGSDGQPVRYRMSPELARRYGLAVPEGEPPTAAPGVTPGLPAAEPEKGGRP